MWTDTPINIGSDDKSQLWLDASARSTHLHVIGASGRGKSKGLEYMIRQDINAGHGLCLIDPHGGLVENLVQWAASHQKRNHRKIMLLNLADPDWRFGFNPLADDGYTSMGVRAEETIGILSAVFGDEDQDKTPRFARVGTMAVYAATELGLSFAEAFRIVDPFDQTGLRRFAAENLQDEHYRDQIYRLDRLADQRQGLRQFREETESAENRFARLMRSRHIRDSLSLIKTAIDFRQAMEEGHVILVNLQPRGQLSQPASHAYGRMLIRDLVNVALSRTREFPDARPFYLYCDECQHFLGDDTETILDECRKYGLHTILAHQRLGQLKRRGDELYNAVMNGAQTKLVFGVLATEDALDLAQYLYMDTFDPNLIKDVLNKEQAVGTRLVELKSWAETQSTTMVPEVAGSSSTSATGSSMPQGGDITYISTDADTSNITEGYDVEAYASTRSGAEAFETIYQRRASATVSVEEQLLMAAQVLRLQDQREVTLKIRQLSPKTLLVPTIRTKSVQPSTLRRFRQHLLERTYFAVPTSEADAMIGRRHSQLRRRIEDGNNQIFDLPSEAWHQPLET